MTDNMTKEEKELLEEYKELRTPKKILPGTAHGWGVPFKCPNCKKQGQYDQPRPHCMYCGQALEW